MSVTHTHTYTHTHTHTQAYIITRIVHVPRDVHTCTCTSIPMYIYILSSLVCRSRFGLCFFGGEIIVHTLLFLVSKR